MHTYTHSSYTFALFFSFLLTLFASHCLRHTRNITPGYIYGQLLYFDRFWFPLVFSFFTGFAGRCLSVGKLYPTHATWFTPYTYTDKQLSIFRSLTLSYTQDDLDYVGRHSKLSPEDMCSTLLAVNCAIEPSENNNLNWTIFIPPMSDRPMYTFDEEVGLVKQASIVQVTDMHADLHYVTGTESGEINLEY